MKEIREIHTSLVNGQNKQAVNQIDKYGLYDFFEDYLSYLKDIYIKEKSILEYFSAATIIYFRIKNR
jgi:hypothetical protein